MLFLYHLVRDKIHTYDSDDEDGGTEAYSNTDNDEFAMQDASLADESNGEEVQDPELKKQLLALSEQDVNKFEGYGLVFDDITEKPITKKDFEFVLSHLEKIYDDTLLFMVLVTLGKDKECLGDELLELPSAKINQIVKEVYEAFCSAGALQSERAAKPAHVHLGVVGSNDPSLATYATLFQGAPTASPPAKGGSTKVHGVGGQKHSPDMLQWPGQSLYGHRLLLGASELLAE
ncbi:hypothetical protein PSHT_02419 [Puccinia striiformis]|uniref:Uncharacterized protein n=1 Tax=Puccinia striiformis TaxID=27350 RepID=A0A2S4WHV8_9BASI|nr:hypothetical protein PSHT_02419 [Puccinia striiformis]